MSRATMEAFWNARLAERAATICWKRKNGEYVAELARDIEAAWIAAQGFSFDDESLGFCDCGRPAVLKIGGSGLCEMHRDKFNNWPRSAV